MSSSSLISQPLTLPCGAVLSNRLCKAAMTEGVADEHLRATARHQSLYKKWSEGGAGLLLTGNVQIDRRVLERPANVAIDPSDAITTDVEARDRLSKWAKAGTFCGNHLWMQLSHAGRQSPRYITSKPLGPSQVQLDLLGNYAAPRELAEDEILDFVQRFARAAAIARETGFTGVQIHSAHGYLLSSFLSPVTNQRQDAWGGSLDNRARFLLETVRAVRKSLGKDFPISVKLNSDDFRKGGFNNEDCLRVVQWLNAESIDLLEISGGNYEQPTLLGHTGDGATAAAPLKESTQKREAYFLEYAERIREVATMPIMVTGGFRTRDGMEAALSSGACDVIGIGRPLVTQSDAAGQLLSGSIDALPSFDENLCMAQEGFFSLKSPLLPIKFVNIFGSLGWYYLHLMDMADDKPLNMKRGALPSFLNYMRTELVAAFRMHRARRKR